MQGPRSLSFGTPRPRRRGESVVAMINVVFLLLVFFLMTAQIAPPDPVEVTPPLSAGTEAGDALPVLVLAADGTLAYGPLRGQAAVDAAQSEAGETLTLRADAEVPGAVLAALLPQFAQGGAGAVRLITGLR